MASDEILSRIDEHMARGNELMEEIKREHELNRREHELSRLAFTENAIVMARLNEVLDRIDRSHGALVARIEAQTDEVRANTNAIIRLLNRLGNGGADPAAA